MEFRHILFPVDFSPRCYAAVPHVKVAAERFGADITLLHVLEAVPMWAAAGDGAFVPDADLSELQADAVSRLTDFAASGFPGLRPACVVEQNEAGQAIVRRAQSSGADLIMMPTHGHGVFRSMLLGSTTSKVLHDATPAVWTAAHLEDTPTPQHTAWKNIVCAVDLVPESVQLIRMAAQLAGKDGGQASIVHSVPGTQVRPDMYFDMTLENSLKDFASVEIAKMQAEAGTDFPVCLEIGNVSNVVAAAATQNSADLVIIGRGVIHKFAGRLRTHAYAIIRDSPCPVLSI